MEHPTSRRTSHLRLLTGHFLRRFLDNDLIAPDQDLHASFAAVLAAVIIVSATVALAFLSKYNPHEAQPLAEKLAMALDDKTLLIGGAMILMALATVLAWDSLSLDARDCAILGPLPIRTTTLLASKTVALAALVAVLAVALNVIPAIVFPVVVLAKAPVGLGYGIRWMGAHAVAGVAACTFTFLAVAGSRVLLGLALPARMARRVLPALQFGLLLVLLTLLLLLPLFAMNTRPAIEAGSSGVYTWPPLWFLGLEEVLIGRPEPVFLALARTALAAFALVGCLGAAAYLCAFLGSRRRQNPDISSAGASTVRARSFVLSRLAALVASDPLTRATFYFTAHTLVRSARHRLCIAGYLGLGLACMAASILAAHAGINVNRQPLDLQSMAFAAQGNLIFFLLVGVRVAANFPADLDAAWLFRIRATPALRRYQAGTRWAFVLLGVLPLLLLLVPVHIVLWGWYAALVHFAVGCILALLLLDVLFRGSDRIPFVSAFAPARTVLSLRLPFYILGYLVFVYIPPVIEAIWIRRPDLFVAWFGLFVLMVGRFFEWQSSLFHRDRMPVFEDGEEQTRLGLTEWSPRDTTAGETEVGQGFSPASRAGAARPPTRWLAMDEAVGQGFISAGHTSGQTAVGQGFSPASRAAAVWQGFSPADLGQDLTFAFRRLRAAPAFTLFAVVTLALGIGATTAIYSIIDAAVLTPPNIQHIDYVVNLYHSDPRKGNRADISFSLPDYQDYRAAQTVFSHLTAWIEFTQTLVTNGAGEMVVGELVDGDYFRVVGALPALGRTLQPADDRPGAPPVVVLSADIWRRRFGADGAVAGKTVRMNGHVFDVVGVLPAAFRGVFMPNVVPTGVWVPLSCVGLLAREAVRNGDPTDREDRWLLVKGFLKPGRTVADASAELKMIGRRLDQVHPIGRDVPLQYRWTPSATRSWVASPAADFHVHEQVDGMILSLAAAAMAAVGLVLLVACTNLANLMLARGASRRRDIAVRLALGASRWRLVEEQIADAALIALAGGCGAVLVAQAIMRYVASRPMPVVFGSPLHVAPAMNLPVAIVAVAATAVALLVFGLAPAVQLTRTDIRSALSADTANTAVPRWRGRRNLIAGQVAVSVALLAVAVLCGRQIMASSLRNAGLDLDRVALVRLDFHMQAYREDRARQTLDRILDLARTDPGVEVAAVSSGVPSIPTRTTEVTTPDRPFEERRSGGRSVELIAASPEVFRALGIRLRRGRTFDERDRTPGERVAVVGQRAAQGLFGAADPIGRQALVRAYRPGDGLQEGTYVVETVTVVGVAADADGGTATSREWGAVYLPFAQHYEPDVMIVARARRDPALLVGRVRQLALRADPELAILDAGTGVVLGSARQFMPRIIAALTGLLGALALAMAGLYGVLSYVVAGRTREVGVRMALGATRPQVLRLVLFEGVRPVLEGVAVGLGMAAFATVALRPVFERALPAADPAVFTLLPIPFVIAALVACYLPARRAASVDPNVALRRL